MVSPVIGDKAADVIESFPKYEQLLKGLHSLSDNDNYEQLLEIKAIMNELQQYYVERAGIEKLFGRDSRLPFDADYQAILGKLKGIRGDFADDFYIKNNATIGGGKQEKRDPEIEALYDLQVDISDEEWANELQLFDYSEFEMSFDEFAKGYAIWKEDGAIVSKDFGKEIREFTKHLKKKQIDQLFYLSYPSTFVIYAAKMAVEKYPNAADQLNVIRYANFLCEVMKRKLDD